MSTLCMPASTLPVCRSFTSRSRFEAASQRYVMTVQANSLPVTSRILAADGQPRLSFGRRLINSIVAARQREADREILRFSSIHHDWYRAEFGLELERRLLGQ